MPSDPPTLKDACVAIASSVGPLGVERVLLGSALGRVAAGPVVAVEPVPGFDNSAMDGYALRAADTEGAPVTLPINGEARAGRPAPRAIRAGEAMRISTGAILPEGADTVARSELADSADEGWIRLDAAVIPGSDIRRAGEEAMTGAVLVSAGMRVGPIEIGALAAAGVESVPCRCRPRVAIVATGDELTGAGRRLAPGGVRDSNRAMLQALVERRGGRVVSSRSAPDDPGAVTAAIVEAMKASDLVMTCGGISVGPHDHVRAALVDAGVTMVFAGVALAPGRPTAFGSGPQRKPVFGLPGNPLSALVAFRLLVEPALDALVAAREDRTVILAAAQALTRRPGGLHAIPCRLDRTGVTPLAAVGHGPTAALGADGLALVAPGTGEVEPGTSVEVALV